VLKRSVLTEKIARRGLHLTREYSTDPLETFFVRDVVTSPPVTLAGMSRSIRSSSRPWQPGWRKHQASA
jgi:hypothetical protein